MFFRKYMPQKLKVMITGYSGFVGQNLIKDFNGFCISQLSFRYKEKQKIELGDINAIIHLAGRAHDLKKVSQPQDYYDANFELTKQLYDAFLKSAANKFIFISSVKATADAVEDVLTEEQLPNPQTHYGKSKLMAEEYIKAQPLPQGKYYYILRPCMIHGPGNKGNLNLLYQLVKKGIPYPLASFENKRSFLSVKNLCFVIKSLLERDVSSGIYNVADDEALSTNEVVSILADSIKKRPKLWRISVSLIKFSARIGDKLNLPLNTERLNKLTENYVVSNSKIKLALNAKLPLSARDGLRETAKSFKSM